MKLLRLLFGVEIPEVSVDVKLYISADIEGVAGIAHWDEAGKKQPEYPEFRAQMTADVAAACHAAVAAGARDILVKDAHGSGRNIIHDQLPDEARVIRGWSGHPFGMMQDLDDSFDAAVLLGYHGSATDPHNPLSHTFTGYFAETRLNGALCAEFHISLYLAASVNVPIILISGDDGICATAKIANPAMTTVITGGGTGASNTGLHPNRARAAIADGITKAMAADPAACAVTLPDDFELAIRFNNHAKAYRNGFYPGAAQTGPETVTFRANNIFDIARMLSFMS